MNWMVANAASASLTLYWLTSRDGENLFQFVHRFLLDD